MADQRSKASKQSAAPIKDSPLSRPGSGGPGDDRQDNSAGDPESTPLTDKHRDPSSAWAPSSENAGQDKSESDPE